jgi:hypothetical protein
MPRTLFSLLLLFTVAAAARGEEKTCLVRTIQQALNRDSLSSALKKWPEKAKHSTLKYAQEVKETKGLRIFVKSRDTNRILSPYAKLTEFLSNPIATSFNRPRMLTAPSSALGWYLLISYPTDVLNRRAEERNFAQAQGIAQKNDVPGAVYIFSLMMSGYLPRGEGTQKILKHAKILTDWFTNGQGPLPRVADLVKSQLILPSETESLDALMREAYAQAQKEAPGKNEPFSETLQSILTQKLESTLPFREKSQTSRDLIATAFWPEVKRDKLSDIELARRMFFAPPGNPLANIANLLGSRKISIGESLILAENQIENPKVSK